VSQASRERETDSRRTFRLVRQARPRARSLVKARASRRGILDAPRRDGQTSADGGASCVQAEYPPRSGKRQADWGSSRGDSARVSSHSRGGGASVPDHASCASLWVVRGQLYQVPASFRFSSNRRESANRCRLRQQERVRQAVQSSPTGSRVRQPLQCSPSSRQAGGP
jgi:hypothetical protein